MTHLTPDQMSALLDGALEGRAREDVERHLAACERCREGLAALSAQDDLLARALEHDPGEAYFERFPGRVAERIRREAKAAPRAARPAGFFGWLSTPRGLMLAGSTAAVIAVAGLVFMQAREREGVSLRSPELAARDRQVAETPLESANKAAPAPGAAGQPRRVAAPAAPSPILGSSAGEAARRAGAEELKKSVSGAPASQPTEGFTASPEPSSRDEAGGGPPPALESRRRLGERETARAKQEPARTHLIPLRRDASGEQVPARPSPGPKAPEPAAPLLGQGPVTVQRQGPSPLADVQSQVGAQKAQSPALGQKRTPSQQRPANALQEGMAPRNSAAQREQAAAALDQSVAGAGRVCGVVRDPSGQPVAGAEVALADVGR